MQEINLKLSPDMLERINQLRGDVPLADWINLAIAKEIQRGYG